VANPRLVRVSAAAELLGVSDQTVYRLAGRGAIAYFRDPITWHWLFVVNSIERFLAANTVEARRIVEMEPVARRRRTRPSAESTTSAQGQPWEGFSTSGRRAGGGRIPTTDRAASSAASQRTDGNK
jgi:excisionase family DNA binding protein